MSALVEAFHRSAEVLHPRFGVRKELDKVASRALLRSQERKRGFEYPECLRQVFLGLSRKVSFTWALPLSVQEELPRSLHGLCGGACSLGYWWPCIDFGKWSQVLEISSRIGWHTKKKQVWAGTYDQFVRIPQDLEDFLMHWMALGFIFDLENTRVFINKRTKKLDSSGANGRRWREFLGLP